MIVQTAWASLKSVADAKQLSVQHLDEERFYRVFLVDGSLVYEAQVIKDTDECATFEASYKNASNRRVGNSTTALPNPEDYRFRGTSTAWTECPAGLTTHIDMTPSAFEDRWVSGGFVIHKDVNPGDTVSFKVVHPLVGVIETYVPSWLLPPGTGSQKIEVYPARIPAGLILRVSYTNNGSSSAYCGINYILHRRGTGA